MLGMADIKDNRQLIEIQITHTENLNQNDPAPELVSTLTGPLPGQRKRFMSFVIIIPPQLCFYCSYPILYAV